MRAGAVRGAGGGEAGDGGVVAGHGAGDGRLQDQAERHPGAVQGGHQAHVRLLNILYIFTLPLNILVCIIVILNFRLCDCGRMIGTFNV